MYTCMCMCHLICFPVQYDSQSIPNALDVYGTVRTRVRTTCTLYVCMKNLRYHFPTCYAYSVKEPIGELNLKRALDEDTRVFSSFSSLLSSSSPLGQTAVILGVFVFSLSWSPVNPWHVHVAPLYNCCIYMSCDYKCYYLNSNSIWACMMWRIFQTFYQYPVYSMKVGRRWSILQLCYDFVTELLKGMI